MEHEVYGDKLDVLLKTWTLDLQQRCQPSYGHGIDATSLLTV